MSDRIKGFYVVLDADYREDDSQVILNAINQIKGVLSVKPFISDVNDFMARERIRIELTEKVWKALEHKLEADYGKVES